ncbi:MAG: GNAT family N-acetyltransferase [Eubacteriales bacterium]|nr:GNAT family N-acetyltransferase [Eubacteriales bacterium]
MEFSSKIPEIEEYNNLRIKSGKGHEADPKMAERALNSSCYLIGAYDEGTLVGMGRVAGDGAITFVVTDIMVDKAYQRRGIADKIMDHIDEYLKEATDENSFVILSAKLPYDGLYLKHGFKQFDENIRVAMLRDNSFGKDVSENCHP